MTDSSDGPAAAASRSLAEEQQKPQTPQQQAVTVWPPAHELMTEESNDTADDDDEMVTLVPHSLPLPPFAISAVSSSFSLDCLSSYFNSLTSCLLSVVCLLLVALVVSVRQPDSSSSSPESTTSAGSSSPPPSPLSDRLLQPRASLHRGSCEAHHRGLDHMNLPFPSVHYRYYIAVNFHNNDAVLISWIHEMTRLLYYLCSPNRLPASPAPAFNASAYPSSLSSSCSNVFISVYESSSDDRSSQDLELYSAFLSDLRVHHRVVTNGRIRRQQADYRIAFLSKVRNAAMQPFFDQHSGGSELLYDRVLFMNDILYCAEDALRLIAHAAPDVQMTCALDYWSHADGPGPPMFYDSWVLRGLDGRPPEYTWPWLLQDAVARKGMQERRPFSVFCCWDGLVVMTAAEWREYGLHFRARDRHNVSGGACLASECSHVCEDLWGLHGRDTHVIVDPRVHVSYQQLTYGNIASQPWFDSREDMGVWTAEDEQRMRAEQIVPHSVSSWRCRGLEGGLGDHQVELWTEAEKESRRRTMRERGWPGYREEEYT